MSFRLPLPRRQASPRRQVSSDRRSPRMLALLAGLAALSVGGIAAGSVPWSISGTRALGLASRAFTDYGLVLTADGAAELTLLPMPRLGFERTRVTTADGTPISEGGRLTVELAPTALLMGRPEIAAVALDGATIDVGRLDAGAQDGIWTGPLRGLAERFAASGVGHPRKIVLTHTAISAGGEGARDVDAVLSWPLWSASLDCAGSLTWRGTRARFALAGLRPRDLSAQGTSPITTTIAWPEGSLSVDGTATLGATPSLSGHGRLDASDLPRTLAWIGADVALSPFIRDLSLDGAFRASGTEVMLRSVRVGIGNSRLEGAMSASFEGRPSVQATLAAEELDLGPLLAGFVGLLDPDKDGPPRPVALRPLTGSDLDLRLSAGASRIGPMRIEDIAASVLVRGASVEASLNRARLVGTTLKGRLALAANALDPDQTEVRAQGAFDGLDIGALLADLGEERWVLGATQGQFALESAGRDVADLAAHVAGRATFAVEGGTIAGLDLSDVIHRNGALAPGALARRNGRTSFERALVSLKFTDGIGEIGEGFLKASSVNAAIRGSLSLPERRFSARVELQPRAGADSPKRGTLFDISGPWDGVSVKATRLDQGETDPASRGMPLATSPAALRLPASVRAFAP